MNISEIRKDFPALSQIVNNNRLIYFDNAATAMKPQTVIDAVSDYYSTINSNVHRAGHYLSAQATLAYENARQNIADFINANESSEIIFTKGTTESINFLAEVLNKEILKTGDEVILTRMEHHSNIVPWVDIKKNKDIKIKIIEIDHKGNLILDSINDIITDKTKILSITHSSNVLGTINPIDKLIKLAKSRGVVTIIDGAQAIVHEKVDVQQLDCDFYCFSGHKLYAPMGIGVIYGKMKFLKNLNPYQKGGGMINKVSFDSVTYNSPPYRFEAGTPNVSGAIGLSKAIDYISNIGLDIIKEQEQKLLAYGTEKLNEIDDLFIFGQSCDKDPIISFAINGIHPMDLSMILDKLGVASRSGTHCTQPLFEKLNVSSNTRISFAFYNTLEEIDTFVEGLIKAVNLLK